MKTAMTSLMALMVSLTITLAGSNGWGQGGTNPQPTQGAVNGKGTQVQHYTATYADPFFGPVTCTGVHQTRKDLSVQESFTCTAQPAGAMLTNVSPNQTLTMGTVTGWISDFWMLPPAPQVYYALDFNGVVSSDMKSYTAVANY